MRSPWERAELLGLGILALALPLLVYPGGVYDLVALPKTILLWTGTALLLGGWLCAISFSPEPRVARSFLVLPLGGLLVVLIASAVVSVVPSVSVFGNYRRYEGLLTYWCYLSLFFLALQAVRRRDAVRLWSRLAVISGTAVAVYAVAQNQGYDFINWSTPEIAAGRAAATMGNPQAVGMFLAVALALATGLAIEHHNSRRSIPPLIAAVLMGLGLGASGSRTGYLAALVGLIIVFVATIRRAPDIPEGASYRRFGISGLLLAVAAVAVAALLAVRGGPLTQGSLATRFEQWLVAARMTAQRPLLGWGLSTFREVSPRFESFRMARMGRGALVADNAHNWLLQLSATAGVLAVLLVLWMLALALWKGVRLTQSHDAEKSALLAGLLGALGAFFAGALFNPTVVGVAPFFWMALGIVAAHMEPRARLDNDELAAGRALLLPVGVAAGVVCVALAFFAVRFGLADAYYWAGKSGRLLGERRDYFRRASEMNPFIYAYPLALGGEYEQTALAAVSTEDLNRAEQNYEAAVRADPYVVEGRLALARLFLFAQQKVDPSFMVDARRELARAEGVHPYFLQLALLQSEYYRLARDYRRALSYADLATRLDPVSSAGPAARAAAQAAMQDDARQGGKKRDGKTRSDKKTD